MPSPNIVKITVIVGTSIEQGGGFMNVFTMDYSHSRVRAMVHSTGVTHATSSDIPRITPSPATGAAPPHLALTTRSSFGRV